MTALQAYKEYGRKYYSMKNVGNNVTLKNSMGLKVTVSKNSRVYHRGRGRFGIYSAKRDMDKISKGATSLGGKGAIGSGPYRHTSDYKRKTCR